MSSSKLSASKKLIFVICLSFLFFVAELAVGFWTSSLALIADAFHYLNDLVSFMIALAAINLSKRTNAPASLAFGWQRVRVLGAFFNGVFWLGLGLSIFLQAIERFIDIKTIFQPMNILIVGCVGLCLNLISIAFIHDHHDHGHSSDSNHGQSSIPLDLEDLDNPTPNLLSSKQHGELGMNAIVIHILGDILNNLGVIAAALIMMLLKSPARFYADPAISMAIAIMISCSAVPLMLRSGHILLCSTPPDIPTAAVLEKLKSVPGIISVHHLHIWRLSQEDCVASAHIVMSPQQKLTPSFSAGTEETSSAQNTSSREDRRHASGVDSQQTSRVDSMIPGLDIVSGESINERLKRVNETFSKFGIEHVTLQIEEDGGACSIAPTETTRSSEGER